MGSSPALTVPPTQNTAPVLEFRCLYTQDLRRKQKRWQDGRLKFHTFNKRVMVYDERSNFVGDSHWRADTDLNEGEELGLERGGILVEVGECIGKKDQDLSELVDKRVREREERAAAKATVTSPAVPRASYAKPQMPAPDGPQYLRPKPLNAIIGMPTGHYSRAVVSHLSPFEQKHLANQDGQTDGPPAKRQKQGDTPSKSGYAHNLLGATLNLGSRWSTSAQAIPYQPLKTDINRSPIDLTQDENQGTVTRGAATRETNLGRRSAKAQNRGLSRSPRPRNGYARSLTGATSTLSGQETFPCAKHAIRQVVSTNSNSRPNNDANSNTSNGQNTITRPPITLRPTEELEISKQQSSSKHTSEPLASESVQVPIAHKNKPVQESPAARLIAGQPVTSLRIKPRPPRKMMMLMELSRPRQLARDLNAEAPNELPKPTKADNVACTEMAASGKLTFSANNESNTGNILPHLSSRALSASNPLEPQHAICDTMTMPPNARRQAAILAPHMFSDGITTESRQCLAVPIINDTIEPERLENSYPSHRGELPSRQPKRADDIFSASLAQSNLAVSYSNLVCTDGLNAQSGSAARRGSLEAIQEPVSIGAGVCLSRNEPAFSAYSGVDDTRNVPRTSGRVSATETGRRRQIPDTLTKSDGKLTSHPRAAKEIEESEQPPTKNFAHGKAETITGDIAIKPSPTSTTADPKGFSGRDIQKAGILTNLHTTKLTRQAALRSPPMALPANVVNADVPGSKVVPRIAPPPCRTSVRAEAGKIKEDTTACGPAREIISRGPWSRESFDLFGAWRPPGRGAETKSSVAGVD
ncbi:hypothetical protein OIDMADRAFT_47833 [Oidiodendron maius Zn]|uniref:5'-3' DNA helicase ZGRF1-like N-terminal domain-containing protein n=1 Tax=Oidiodendron maius (strain Zn) TaxID=913774 RepID=A0A0C3HYL1_OIDMZ|nr:hypothetical protein OIDMADRAFT_47833 [Oidiodendron maius Zn]